jgi:hypothetical protein
VRLLAVASIFAVLAAVSAMQADAARNPTPQERAEVVRAFLVRLEHDAPAVTSKVSRVVVSTKEPRANSIYSRFAVAYALGRDRAGHLVGSPIGALVGFSRRFQTWVVINYGSDQVGCREPQAFFGGRSRRAAILRDLGLGCP